MHRALILSILPILLTLLPLAAAPPIPELSGPNLGQGLPSGEARIFAPGFVSTGLYTRDLAMTPDGREFYFTVTLGQWAFVKILVTRQLPDGHWTEPEVAPFCAPGSKDIEPHVSPDGKRFFFVSDRPCPGRTEKNFDIWVMDRMYEGSAPGGWSAPRNVGAPISTEHEEFFPTLTQDGTLFFARREKGKDDEIFLARPDKAGFGTPEKLGPEVNSGQARFNACVSPDGSYLVVPTFGRKDSLGGTDYYVCFRKPDGTWTEAKNLGNAVNTRFGLEFSPSVSPDGKALFFMSVRPKEPKDAFGKERTYRRIQELHGEPGHASPAIYWISSSIIQAQK